jgi:hypothetical protein
VGQVAEHWDIHWSETSLLSVLKSPLFVGEVGINGACDNLAFHLVELSNLVGELDNFSWTNEGEVEWIEEEDDVLSLELLEADLLELLVPE